MVYENIISEIKGKVGIITFNRPKALNALNSALITELNMALNTYETDPNIGAIILTGSEKAFAAGADIREMKDKSFEDVTSQNFLHDWDYINTITKPLIAAVSGFALGGGFEYALICDMMSAAPCPAIFTSTMRSSTSSNSSRSARQIVACRPYVAQAYVSSRISSSTPTTSW